MDMEDKIQERVNNIRTRIFRARKEKGYSQREVAKKLKISQAAYHVIETSEDRDIKVGTLLRLSAALGTNLRKLIG